MVAKNTHGGRRKGAGRISIGKEPKRPLGVKVSKETKEKLLELHNSTGHSQASIVEYSIKNLKNLPSKLG